MEIKARETRVNGPALLVLILIPALTLSGCGGSKVLKTPEPYVATEVLVTASDQQVTAELDWVIYRDGPGTWAKNVDWDEYLITVRNRGSDSLQITNITVMDSLGTRVEPGQIR